MRKAIVTIVAIALLSAAASFRRSRDPDFGPNVVVVDPGMSSSAIQSTLDSLFAIQEKNHFGPERSAVLFKPGTYRVNARVGFYTQIAGLGVSPDDVTIDGSFRVDARWKNGNATVNFWRMAENLSVRPDSGFDR